MDATSKPTMAGHEVPEAEPAVQGEEEVQVIGYLDLQNSGLQLVEGDNTFCLPPEALGEHVLMAEDGKEGQPSIIVLVQDASEDDVVQALARDAQAMVEEQTEFTMNQLENAIVADGQQLVFLSEDAGGSAPDQEGAAHQESGLVYQEGPDESLPEHSATTADNGQVELQPESQKSPDVNDDESPNAACEAKAAGSPAAPEDNPESIRGSESAAEPQASPLAPSHNHNGNSECGLVSESETAPLHENIEESVLSKSEVLTHACSHQKRPALPDGEHACDAGDGLMGVSHSSSSDLPSQNPVAVVCAAEAESKTCQHSLEAEHEVPVDRSTSEITRAPSACSWAVDEYEPQPSCSWQRAGVNVRKGRKGKNAKNSGGKLLAALDLVPCHEGSPPGTSLGGGKKTLSKTRRKRNQSPKEHEEVKEKNSPPAKPWNLRVPTKRRKPFVIPDSDDEDFDDYGSEDYPSDTQKFKFEKAFDDLLDNFKTEQAQKAVTEAAPMKRKRGRPPKRKLTTPQPHDTVTEGADESIAKGFEEKKGKLVQEESTAKTSKAKRTERSAKTFKLKTERYEEEKSSAKASNTSEEKSAPTGSSAKTSKGKRGRKPAPIEDYPPMKTAKVESPPSPVASTSGSQRVWQRHVEPAIVLALKKNGSDDDIRMPRSDLRAGDIRIRCQKPSYVSAKASPRYHCAKCDFESSRMQNIVRHHLRDCQHTKSLAKEKDPKSPDDQKGDLKSPDDQKGDPNSPDDQKGAPT